MFAHCKLKTISVLEIEDLILTRSIKQQAFFDSLGSWMKLLANSNSLYTNDSLLAFC